MYLSSGLREWHQGFLTILSAVTMRFTALLIGYGTEFWVRPKTWSELSDRSILAQFSLGQAVYG